MSFADDLNRFNAKQQRLTRTLFVNVASATHGSIQSGSAVTGAPGQPVQTGNLRISWQLVFNVVKALIMTNTIYARVIEEGTRNGRALTLRSRVGGFHSVSKTIQGFRALVEDEARKLGAT